MHTNRSHSQLLRRLSSSVRRLVRLSGHLQQQQGGSVRPMSSTSSSEIITSKQDGIGTIILNRPKALNALTVGMVRALDAVFHTWEDDPDVSSNICFL